MKVNFSVTVGLQEFILTKIVFMLPVIFWLATHRNPCLTLLQQLTSLGFCLNILLGRKYHLVYPNLKLFLDIKNIYCYH